ncbi:MAG: VWA domain-containing protein [Vicinamibacterales bacterium]
MTGWSGLFVSGLALAATPGVTPAAQAPSLSILTPADGEYVSDRVAIEARVEPAERTGDVTGYVFFADGREVCRVEAGGRPRCVWDAGPIVRAHQLRVVATLADGARLVATRRTPALDVVERTAVRVVQVPAIVTDRDGGFVRGLSRDAFRLVEDGVPQTIQHFSSEEAPLELVLALDVSQSMGEALPALKQAVGEFVTRLPPGAAVSLVAFNDEMFPIGQPSDTVARRLEMLGHLQPFGGTALYDVMMRGFADLSRGSGRRALVIFTDGDDQSSRATRAQVQSAVEASDVALYFVALGRGQEVEQLLDGMDGLATLSGGRVLRAARSGQLGERFGDVLAELSHQYLIGYAPTNGAADGRWRKIDLTSPRRDLRIRARQGYRAPSR